MWSLSIPFETRVWAMSSGADRAVIPISRSTMDCLGETTSERSRKYPAPLVRDGLLKDGSGIPNRIEGANRVVKNA